MKQNLIHIVYVSFAASEMSAQELEDLLSEVRRKNEKINVTGLLLYNQGSFIQVIEGERDTIIELFDQIKRDSRHDTVVKLLEEPIGKRAYPDWSMGFRRINNEQTSQIVGSPQMIYTPQIEKRLKASTHKVMELLNSFKKYT